MCSSGEKRAVGGKWKVENSGLPDAKSPKEDVRFITRADKRVMPQLCETMQGAAAARVREPLAHYCVSRVPRLFSVGSSASFFFFPFLSSGYADLYNYDLGSRALARSLSRGRVPVHRMRAWKWKVREGARSPLVQLVQLHRASAMFLFRSTPLPTVPSLLTVAVSRGDRGSSH